MFNVKHRIRLWLCWRQRRKLRRAIRNVVDNILLHMDTLPPASDQWFCCAANISKLSVLLHMMNEEETRGED